MSQSKAKFRMSQPGTEDQIARRNIESAIALLCEAITLMEQAGCEIAAAHAQMAHDLLTPPATGLDPKLP